MAQQMMIYDPSDPSHLMSRLQREGQRYALLTACADGGLAHACILERYDNK